MSKALIRRRGSTFLRRCGFGSADFGLIIGIEATGKEIDSVFARHGIAPVEAMDQTLDPNRHQAMLEVPSEEAPGTIVQELQSGYTIKDRLLRPALVGVARKG